MSILQAGRLCGLLCVLGMLATATDGAEPSATVKQYAFELRTLNLADTVRAKQVRFNISNGMTEEELDAVNQALDELGASAVNDEGYRDLALSNGTRVRIGGFLTEGYLEDSVEGVHNLPLEFSVQDEFSTTEAALVVRLATAGNLFIGSTADPERIATLARVEDKRFYKLHKQAGLTPDEEAVARWIALNVAPRDVPASEQPAAN